MSSQNIFYVYPQAAYALLCIVLILILFRYLQYYRTYKLTHFASKSILRSLLIPRSFINYLQIMVCVCLAWIFATLALMGPTSYGYYPQELKQRRPEITPKEQSITKRKPENIIFLLDASASMKAKDEHRTNSRFDAAKEIIDATISKLTGENIALHTFTSEPTQLSPLTMDYLFVRLVLRYARINEGGAAGTNFENTFTDIRKEFFEQKNDISTYLVVFTDGEDTHLEGLSESEKAKGEERVVDIFKEAKANHLHVITIGMGTKEGSVVPGVLFNGKPVNSALNEALLQRISQAGNGNYFYANNYATLDLANTLKGLFEQENKEKTEKEKQTDTPEDANVLIHDLYFQIPLGIAILLLSYALLLPEASRDKSKT